MHEVKAIVRSGRLEAVLQALHAMPDLPGVTVSDVRGVGRAADATAGEAQYGETQMAKLEIVVPEGLVEAVLSAIETAGRTGHPGDGKIFVSAVSEVVHVRSGDRGRAAL